MRKSTQLLCCMLSLLLCLLTLTACSPVLMGGLPETVSPKADYTAYASFQGPTAFEYAPVTFDAEWVTENFAEAASEEEGVRLFVSQEDENVVMKMSDTEITLYDLRDGDQLVAHYTTTGVIESAEYYVDWTALSEGTEERTAVKYSYTFTEATISAMTMDTYHLTGAYDERTMLWTTTMTFDGTGSFSSGKHTVYTDGSTSEYTQYGFNMLGLCQSVSYAMTGADANGEYVVLGSYSTEDGKYLGCTWYDMTKATYTYYNARGREITLDQLRELVQE